MADVGAVLPDLIGPGLRLVLCGSAVSTVSAKVGAPYAGPGNKFWPTLFKTRITPNLFAPEDWQALSALKIGLTDINKQQSGSDSSLSGAADDPAALMAKIRAFQPDCLAFTAKRPAQVFLRHAFDAKKITYGLQSHKIGDTDIFVLPSPSGLAVRYWDPAHWHALAAHLRKDHA